MRRIEDVLDRKKTAGLKLKPEKCELLQKEVCFLGHVINEKGILPNPDNVTKVLLCSVPKSATIRYPTILRHRKLLQEIHQDFLQSGQANGQVN